ncbi:MAG: dihydroorotase [Bacteroidota bacterium]
MNIYFKNINLISPEQKINKKVNLWVNDGIIKHCSNKEAEIDSKTKVIDAAKMVCSPGWLDMHVHLREPGFEEREDVKSGCEAAANGGFSGIVCMPNTDPVIDNAPVVEYIKSKAVSLLTDVHICGSITQNLDGKHISPMLELIDHGVVMFSDDGKSVIESSVMKLAFEYAATKDLIIAQHCEDHTLTQNFAMNEGFVSIKLGLKGYPNIAEDMIVARDLMLADYLGNRRYHVCHVSTIGAVRLIREAKERGLRISCEVTPHHFSLDEENIKKYNTDYKMNPPLRTNQDIQALIEGLIDGTIDCIASDHAPHTLYDKEVEFEKAPNGIVGLETSLGVTLTKLYHTGYLTIEKIIEKCAVNPRKILKLPQILVKEGEKANLTIFAPDEEWVVDKKKFKSKSKNTPFDGFELKGKPKYTINNGKIYQSAL